MLLDPKVSTPKREKLVGLLLQGCDTTELASGLGIAKRTVKAQLKHLYLYYGFPTSKGKLARVELAVSLYRRQLALAQASVDRNKQEASN